jgi:PhzF family phenazine biosynthesis protein
MNIKIFQVDAFSGKPFAGNPAAVCMLDEPISENLMQNIAMENNLSETAFVISNGDEFDINYFSPKMEIDLCGHASLASAYVIDQFYSKNTNKIVFNTHKVGQISVEVRNGLYALNLPVDEFTASNVYLDQLNEILNIRPIEVYEGKTDLMAVFENEEQIKALKPDFALLLNLDIRGLIVTAPGKSSDIVCRFFCPAIGINEDPVTGSAHTTLVPYWSAKLGKKEFVSNQISERSGELYCRDLGNRVEVAGAAVLFMKGQIEIG